MAVFWWFWLAVCGGFLALFDGWLCRSPTQVSLSRPFVPTQASFSHPFVFASLGAIYGVPNWRCPSAIYGAWTEVLPTGCLVFRPRVRVGVGCWVWGEGSTGRWFGGVGCGGWDGDGMGASPIPSQRVLFGVSVWVRG